MRRRAFTLIELLVVIAIIALLISILLPSLAAAKEQANKVKCEANLHAFGQSTTLFAQDNSGHLPCAQLGIWGPPPWWGALVYTRDFIQLKDNYGMAYKEWVCPARAPADTYYDRMTYGWLNGNATLAQFQAGEQDAYNNYYNKGLYPDPWQYKGNPGSGNAYGLPADMATIGYYNAPHFIEIMDYENMFGNPWNTFMPYMVTKAQGVANEDATAYPSLAQYNSNPPIIADATLEQNSGQWYRFGHGRTWKLGSAVDPNTNSVSSHIGDVSVNVLYADGHAENKKPELTSYQTGGSSAWFY